jgi:hypothetical protein
VTKALNDIARIAELLRFSTSRKVVQDYLRTKNLPFSGGWDDLIEKRIIQNVNEGNLAVDDFLGLRSSAEECGKQHVFLYQCSAKVAEVLLAEQRRLPILRDRKLDGLIANPLALDTPDGATIVDIRHEKATVPLSLTVKEVYSHEAYKPAGVQRNGSQLVRTWDVVRTRAVNVAKLGSVRIFVCPKSLVNLMPRHRCAVKRSANRIANWFFAARQVRDGSYPSASKPTQFSSTQMVG